MKVNYNYFTLVIILALLSCNSKTKPEKSTPEAALKVYDYKGLEPLLSKKDNTIYVVNFWATWCAPCVKELPAFEKLYSEYKSKGVEVVLVSLDFPSQYEKKLKPFIKSHKLQSTVVALNDVDANTWIPKVDENWSGAIPATLIYKNEKRRFYEQSFDYDTLKNEVELLINTQ